mmetsp:Transcript_46748/g.109043  ORF Transcript_46748/g.109043 Transcript_46748/m.109043 type:complete len:408 (-) Transcript_46748:91-1314(-)
MTIVRLPKSFAKARQVAKQQCLNLTMGDLMRRTGSDTESLTTAARWVQQQIPVRVARRLDDFLQLPFVVVSNPNISQVLSIYLETFEALGASKEVETSSDEEDFCALVRDQLHKHAPVAQLIAEGYREVRQTYPNIRLDGFLNDFFVARIALRIVLENYVEMRNPQPGWVGIVKQHMNPGAIVRDLGSQISDLTRSIYDVAPDIEFRGNEDCQLDYIPRHLSYMVRELLKNAFRSTVERHQHSGKSAAGGGLPPVVVELQQGDVHVIIKISDQGGGMPKKIQQEAWQYGWTTVKTEADDQDQLDSLFDPPSKPKKKELAGYGFGLPLTRLHAQYFGGDVFMQALPGHGTDMYLLLTHLKEGTPSTEIDDLSTVLYQTENENRTGSCRVLGDGQEEVTIPTALGSVQH